MNPDARYHISFIIQVFALIILLRDLDVNLVRQFYATFLFLLNNCSETVINTEGIFI